MQESTTQRLEPGSPEWVRTISASKVPAILGVSRFTSPYRVWHEMAGNIPPEDLDADRMAWGHIAEHSLAEWWKHHNPGWQLNVGGEITYTNPDLPFPNLATLDRRAMNRKVGQGKPGRFHIIECKTALALDDWGRPGEPDSIPADYFAQVMFQMGVSGITTASVVVLGPFSEPEIHNLEFDQSLFDAMVDRLADWWDTLQAGDPPALDDTVATYEAVRGLHPDIEKGAEAQVDEAEAHRILATAHALDAAEADMRATKTRIADLMGNAQYLRCGDVKIADRRARGQGTPYPQINKKAQL